MIFQEIKYRNTLRFLFLTSSLVAPIGFMEAKIDGLLPVSGAGLDFYSDASIFYILY